MMMIMMSNKIIFLKLAYISPTAGYRPPLMDERERAVVFTVAQCGLGTSHMPLNFFVDIICFAFTEKLKINHISYIISDVGTSRDSNHRANVILLK
jgi:hypothetical protein